MKVDLERLRRTAKDDAPEDVGSWRVIGGPDLQALLAVVDAAREVAGTMGYVPRDKALLRSALEPFTPPTDDTPEFDLPKYFLEDYGAVGDGVTDDTEAVKRAFAAAGSSGVVVSRPGKTYLVSSPIPLVGVKADLAGSTLRMVKPDRATPTNARMRSVTFPANDARAWEEVDRWNAQQERDLAVKAAVDAAKPNPRDRARDQLADAGVVVQRQFRSDQERIAELETERDALETELVRRQDNNFLEERIAELEARLARVPALVEAVGRHLEECCRTDIPPSIAGHDVVSEALAEWERS